MGAYHVEGADYVGLDLHTGIREAAEHLRNIGCRRIAYIASEPHVQPGKPRIDAYLDVLQDAGLVPESDPARSAFS